MINLGLPGAGELLACGSLVLSQRSSGRFGLQRHMGLAHRPALDMRGIRGSGEQQALNVLDERVVREAVHPGHALADGPSQGVDGQGGDGPASRLEGDRFGHKGRTA